MNREPLQIGQFRLPIEIVTEGRWRRLATQIMDGLIVLETKTMLARREIEYTAIHKDFLYAQPSGLCRSYDVLVHAETEEFNGWRTDATDGFVPINYFLMESGDRQCGYDQMKEIKEFIPEHSTIYSATFLPRRFEGVNLRQSVEAYIGTTLKVITGWPVTIDGENEEWAMSVCDPPCPTFPAWISHKDLVDFKIIGGLYDKKD